MKNKIKSFLLINLGILISVISIYFFLVPNKFAIGGITGLTILIFNLFPSIPFSLMFFTLSAIVIAMGSLNFGKNFGLSNVYIIIITSLLLQLFAFLFPNFTPFSNDKLINLIFGIIILAIAIVIILNQGAATGGTDILAKIIHAKTSLSIGQGLILMDGMITIGSCFINGFDLGMYSVLGAILNSILVDKFIQGFNSKYNVTIVSNKLETINDYILKTLNKGSTIYSAKGGYTNAEKNILVTILNKKEYITLKTFIKNTDPNAFIYISDISEVMGKGFISK